MKTTETGTEATETVVSDQQENGVLNPVENPVSETTVTGNDNKPKSTESEDIDQILDDLGSVDFGDEKAIETTGGEVRRVEGKIDKQAIELKSKMEAAIATGGIATVIEKVMSPVSVTEEMRTDFYEALYPVLMGYGGAGMPDWLAKIWDDWKAEITLARKTVAIGWAIHEQRRDIKAGKVKAVEKKKRYRLPASATSRKVDKDQEAA